MLLFVVARSRLDRYEELGRQCEAGVMWGLSSTVVKGIVAPPHGTLPAVDRRRAERRINAAELYSKLGWTVVETDDSISRIQ